MTIKKELIKQADSLVRQYLISKYKTRAGTLRCYTCSGERLIKEMQVGHFIRRSYSALRWDVNNVRPQCPKCNCLLSGNLEIYENKLAKELGDSEIERMREKRNLTKYYYIDCIKGHGTTDLNEVVKYYKELIPWTLMKPKN